MSFSIPVAEDIGPTQLYEQLLNDQDQESGGVGATSGLMIGNSLTAMKRFGGANQRELKKGTTTGGGDTSTTSSSQKQLHDFLFLSGQTRSPLAGAVGDTSDKRDVISVGQCCNMMETEDVSTQISIIIIILIIIIPIDRPTN